MTHKVKSNIIIDDDGCLRQHLDNNFISLDWEKKSYSLHSIANGLKNIHNSGLIHRDFHCGNILSTFSQTTFITDLGLCQPAKSHDEFLALKICQGLRPKSTYKIPQVILDTINQCWDADPLKRPKADELHESILNILSSIRGKDTIIIYWCTFVYNTSQAVYTSRLLDFNNLPEPKNADNDETESLESLRIGFTKLDVNSKDESN
ncbi:unnamed protein product [Rhizophagus irregularis]|nr:unnamed protein product [Rhizophagus irregularis]